MWLGFGAVQVEQKQRSRIATCAILVLYSDSPVVSISRLFLIQLIAVIIGLWSVATFVGIIFTYSKIESKRHFLKHPTTSGAISSKIFIATAFFVTHLFTSF